MSTNYPGSLDSYTTKVDNVDDVLASHVNDMQDAIEALEAKTGVTSSGVNTSLDYFLKNASGSYRTHTHDGTSDDGAAIPLDNLSDVVITAVADDNILRYDTASGKWVNEALTTTLAGLSDVTIATPTIRQGLYYDTEDSKWKNGSCTAVYAE